MRPVALPPALVQARTQFRARWARLAPRERLLVSLAAAVVVLGGAWALLVQPAVRSLRELPPRIEAVDAELQQMQRLAAEARELRGLPTVRREQAGAALQAASERLGANAKLVLQGDRALLNVNGVPGAALVGWLGEARSAARARPDEVRLSFGPNGYSGSVTLTLPGTTEAR